jgi:hypothetical protein
MILNPSDLDIHFFYDGSSTLYQGKLDPSKRKG